MDKLIFNQNEVITAGWSGDKKFCVTDEHNQKFLLRISSIDKYEGKKVQFEILKQLEQHKVPMCKPVAFGTCEEGVYLLQSWIKGTMAENTIPIISKEKQYAYGLKAGEILTMIHSVPAFDNIEDWDVRFNRKIDRKIKMYEECPLSYENGDLLLTYIEDNRVLLKNRPQSYQHGDYHIGNMMIDESGELIVIDFDRNDFGDPWEEFNRIVWCAKVSPSFASGMVDGYFNHQVPMEFWRLLALYIATNTLSSLPWAIPYGENEVKTMREQAKDVLNWYDNMQKAVPNWYIPQERKEAYL